MPDTAVFVIGALTAPSPIPKIAYAVRRYGSGVSTASAVRSAAPTAIAAPATTSATRARPAPVSAVNHRRGQREQRHDDQQLRNEIEAPRPVGARFADEPRGQGEPENPERDIDPEDRSPADGLDEQSPEQGTRRHGQTEGRSPDTDRPGPLLRVEERVDDDGHRHGVEHRSADRLQRAERHQGARAGRDAAEQRSNAEDHQTRLKNLATTEAIRERSGEQEKARHHDGVGVDRPLELGQAGT